MLTFFIIISFGNLWEISMTRFVKSEYSFFYNLSFARSIYFWLHIILDTGNTVFEKHAWTSKLIRRQHSSSNNSRKPNSSSCIPPLHLLHFLSCLYGQTDTYTNVIIAINPFYKTVQKKKISQDSKKQFWSLSDKLSKKPKVLCKTIRFKREEKKRVHIEFFFYFTNSLRWLLPDPFQSPVAVEKRRYQCGIDLGVHFLVVASPDRDHGTGNR